MSRGRGNFIRGERVKFVLSGTLPDSMYKNEALCVNHLHDNEKGIQGVVFQYRN